MGPEEIIVEDFVSVIYVRHQAGDRVFMKNRYVSGIIATAGGVFRFIENDSVLFMEKRRAVLVPKGATYTIECDEGLCMVLNFTGRGLPEHLASLPEPPDADFEATFARIHHLWKTQPRGYRLAALAELYSYLYGICRHASAANETEALLARAQMEIRKRCAEADFHCRDVAQILCVSESYFRRLFRAQFGASPSEFRQKLRMERARALLLEHVPVQQTALQVGYQDVYQFSRAYKAHFGCPPSREARESE